MEETFDGIHRMKFLVSETGSIMWLYVKASPKTNALQIKEDFKKLSRNPKCTEKSTPQCFRDF